MGGLVKVITARFPVTGLTRIICLSPGSITKILPFVSIAMPAGATKSVPFPVVASEMIMRLPPIILTR